MIYINANEFLGTPQRSEDTYTIRPTVYGMVSNTEGKIATIQYKELVRNIFPGGGIEAGESPVEALRRELREEIGYDVTDIQLVAEFDSWPFDRQHAYPTKIYTAKAIEPGFPPKPTEDYEMGSTVVWRTCNEIAKIYQDLQGDPQIDSRPYVLPEIMRQLGVLGTAE